MGNQKSFAILRNSATFTDRAMDNADEEHDEVLEAYIAKYQLDDELPRQQRKQAIFLIGCIRKLRRLDFPDLKRAAAAHGKANGWLAECRVFHKHEHAGYNELLSMVETSLESIGRDINEKYSC